MRQVLGNREASRIKDSLTFKHSRERTLDAVHGSGRVSGPTVGGVVSVMMICVLVAGVTVPTAPDENVARSLSDLPPP